MPISNTLRRILWREALRYRLFVNSQVNAYKPLFRIPSLRLSLNLHKLLSAEWIKRNKFRYVGEPTYNSTYHDKVLCWICPVRGSTQKMAVWLLPPCKPALKKRMHPGTSQCFNNTLHHSVPTPVGGMM